MKSDPGWPIRQRSAIVLSLAAHVCALWLVALALGGRESLPTADVEGAEATLSGPTIVTIVRRGPVSARHAAVPSQRPIVAANEPATSAPVVLHHARARKVRVAASRVTGTIRTTAAMAAISAPLRGQGRPLLTLALVAPAAAATTKAVVAASTPPPTPTPTPTPVPAPTATPTPPPATSVRPAESSFSGLFSQNYPPAIAEPAALSALRSRLAGHARLRVAVDETGHATDVQVIGGNAAASVADLRAAFLDLRYVPADCNGLHCDGYLEIAY